jgi:fermentation-respiration switch protein FrsA (DUF1100 family)
VSEDRVRPDVVGVEEHPRYRHETWEFAGSAGDPVRAEAWLASGSGPVVIAGHGADSDRNAQYIRGAAMAWAGRGMTVVAADAPMHGERDRDRPPPEAADLQRPAFVERAAADTRRLADAVQAGLGDDRSLGYLGFSMGTQYGVAAVAADLRFRAAVFAVGGSTTMAFPRLFEEAGPEVRAAVRAADPIHRAAEIAPRPVLMVNADDDEVFSRESALGLYDAFRPPKEITFFPGGHTAWRSPAQWYRRIEHFLRETLR